MRITAGEFRNRKLQTPKGQETRPTASRLREAFFNICQHEVEGCSFLDLFSGSGSMGFEALSRGAERVCFIEKSRQVTSIIKANAKSLGVVDRVEVITGDVIKMVPKLSASYSLIYSDPPYQQQCVWHGKKVTLSDALLSLIDKSTLLKDGGLFFLEDAAPIENSELQSLLLKDVRKYGIASLSIYQKREIS